MSRMKHLLLAIEEANTELAELSEQEREARISEIYDEMLHDMELLRQHEAMSYAAELENFSPFDTVNS